MKTRELPEKLSPGDELEVQLAPYGEWPNVIEDENGKPKEVTQRFGPEDAEKIVAAFGGELLVDADHASCEGGSTLAYAWVTSVRADPELGLTGTFRFTDKGAEAVNSREYRFLSVAWFCDEGGHPFELDSVALTNRPNLPVRPILNRKPPVRNNMFTEGDMASSSAGGGSAEQTKDTHMDKLKALLGLDAGADEAAIEAAVQSLLGRVADMEKKEKDAEAEAFAAENEDKCDRETLKNAFLASPETAKAIVAGIKTAKAPAAPAKTEQKLLNAAAAKAPAIGKATKEQLAALPPGERAAFYKAHKADFTN